MVAITTVGFRQDLRRNRAVTIHEAEAGDAPVLSEVVRWSATG
jgi:hypothetical protein